MASAYKTPGVYIVEQNAFPPSIVAVETAVPAFIGYTETSVFKGQPLANRPFKVTSMSAFTAAYGGPPPVVFKINKVAAPGDTAAVAAPVAPTAEDIAAVKALTTDAPTLAAIDTGKLTDDQRTALTGAAGKLKDPDKTTATTALAKFGTEGPTADQKKVVTDLLAQYTALSTAVAAGPLTAAQLATLKAAADAETDPTAKQAAEDAVAAFAAAPATPPAAVAADPAAQKTAVKAALDADVKTLEAAIDAGTALSPVQLAMLQALAADPATTADNKTALQEVIKTGTPAPAVPATTPAAAPHDAEFHGDTDQFYLTPVGNQYLLYQSMLLFFQNGGGPCWIVSVGGYGDDIKAGDDVTPKTLLFGLEKLKDEREPTMVVIPDAVRLAPDQCVKVQEQMLKHCGEDMKNRFAILDIANGDQGLQDAAAPVDTFRNTLSPNNLNYGAAYYPWLNTTLIDETDISYRYFIDPADPTSTQTLIDTIKQGAPAWPAAAEALITAPLPASADDQAKQARQVNNTLIAVSPMWKAMAKVAARKLNLLPPAAAMAGIYTAVDNARGVWKAPANVGVNSVTSPAVPISDYWQQGLNVDPMGKSVNVIRSFIGEGVLVWGARTLDGNSLDWRYINVRRTMIFLEESCRLAAKQMVFEPNVDGTWVTVRSMISNFLHGVWRQGGLAGAVPEDAYSVFCGLGSTMTADDVLEGYLRVTVLVAVSHPAEFVEITFQQEMQKS